MSLEKIKDQMHSGQIYFPNDEGLMSEQMQCMEKMYDYNETRPSEGERRKALLQEMMAEAGEGCYIEPPLRANWGGHHVHLGKGVYANFNLTLVDDTHIYVGDYTMIGPNVTIATAGHPILPELREKAYQYNAPVHIRRNCWLGAGVVVHDRRQHRDRSRQRCHKGYSGKCGCGGKSVPCASPDRGTRQGILL